MENYAKFRLITWEMLRDVQRFQISQTLKLFEFDINGDNLKLLKNI